MSDMILDAILVGVVATGVMDLVALAQSRLFGIPSLDYAMLGRWLAHMPRGRLIHRSIGQSPRIRGEAAMGWSAHYLTGILFTAAFFSLMGQDWTPGAKPVAPVIFGMATVVAPFLLLQPGMGAGLAARRTSSPWRSRARSLQAHATFGLGIWIGSLLLVSARLGSG